MCGRFTLRTPTPVLIHQFQLATAPELTARYNIAPTQDVPVVRATAGTGVRELVLIHWGLVPSWSKDVSRAGRMINARAETIAEKPAFRAAFRRRRCLVITDGYYEWKSQAGKKQPYFIHRSDDQAFALAGLWETWNPAAASDRPPDSEGLLQSCTIITTPANRLTSDLHDRMPAILETPDYDRWLDPTNTEASALQGLLTTYESDEMRVDPVSPYVNNARHEGPQCVQVQGSLF